MRKQRQQPNDDRDMKSLFDRVNFSAKSAFQLTYKAKLFCLLLGSPNQRC
ncbi:uncharacterized protein PHALS_05884 [Plasmopara halstedii]|uniref:Uncharacterized protein n=1 Tax=Plasmopara halstedii TaxID=4781 RepID=A0A0P1AAK0_PLAHL|nr:uncharacterized protein PHALS_05884 [Plasmopara halstedii]CEG37830.1 hypothetical protein PHALS_05884 [Plasmopara halstedii]|eukprot:XP_024574199.1 hypothetical protein PHALS_05884 [Plasmopara halstedii]